MMSDTGSPLHQQYTLARLPAGAITAAAGVIAELSEPVSALLVEEGAVTLLIRSDAWAGYARRLPGAEVIAVDLLLLPAAVRNAQFFMQRDEAGKMIFVYSGADGLRVFVPAGDDALASSWARADEPD